MSLNDLDTVNLPIKNRDAFDFWNQLPWSFRLRDRPGRWIILETQIRNGAGHVKLANLETAR